MTSLGFLGIGNMGTAILNGFKAENVSLYAYDAFPEKRAVIEKHGGVFLGSELELADKCKYIILAVKPQSAAEVLEKIKPVIVGDKSSEKVIVSICAGISSAFIRSHTSADAKVIRVMPNTPMMVGLGASAVSTDGRVSPEETEFALSIFRSCGIAEIIPEDKMNEVICINASSPAFIYLFTKCFTEYAVGQGIDEKTALNLFSQTLIGSANMLFESGKSVDELIAQVSSKGGTTVAGLEKLLSYNGDFADIIKSACEACTKRAYELGETQ